MPSDQDQDGGEHGRASHNGAHMSSAPRQRLAGRIPERRVDLARRRDAGQLVVAAVVVVHLEAALSLQARQPARAPRVRRGVRGVRRPGATAWRPWSCLCGKLFALAARLHRSKQRKPGRQRASFTLAGRSCVFSTSACNRAAARYDSIVPQDARPGPNPLTAPRDVYYRVALSRPLTPSAREKIEKHDQ